MQLIVLVLSLVLFVITTATGQTLDQYFPNPLRLANGYQLHTRVVGRAGEITHSYAYLFNWDFATNTGIFYIAINPPDSTPCPNGKIQGTHDTFGVPNSGVDWYAWTPVGLHYLGWMYWYPNCDLAMGITREPYNDYFWPKSLLYTPFTKSYTLIIDGFLFSSMGVLLEHTQGTTFTTYLRALHVKLFDFYDFIELSYYSEPTLTSTPYHIAVLAKEKGCWCGTCWKTDPLLGIEGDRGVWYRQDHTDVNTTTIAVTAKCTFENVGWLKVPPLTLLEQEQP